MKNIFFWQINYSRNKNLMISFLIFTLSFFLALVNFIFKNINYSFKNKIQNLYLRNLIV